MAQETLKNPANENEYLIGKAIGQGSLGIVYVAWDIANNRKVAVKECFPYSRIVNRTHSNAVNISPNTQENVDFFNRRKKRFRQEAQKMMLFSDSPNIVNVFEFFEANNTAYIVMEFIEGQTFAQVLGRVPNRRLSMESVLTNLKPLVNILERMHNTIFADDDGWQSAGIIHRGINPDNIFFSADGSVKLLDFVSLTFAELFDNHSTMVYRMNCHWAYEQYLSIGSAAALGSWTDVYAFAATIYQAITGKLPPSATERSVNDTIELPSSFGVNISPYQERVLLKGLAVNYKNRYQSIKQFYDDLLQPPIPQTSPKVEQSDSPWKKILWGVAVVAVIAAFLLCNKMNLKNNELAELQKQTQLNQEKLKGYGEFAADYGYGSDSYYADKAVVFVNKNSEVKLPVYCDLKDFTATLNFLNGKGLVNLKWEAPFDEAHKANVIIRAGDNAGYATIRFTNNINSDNFEVLVVVPN